MTYNIKLLRSVLSFVLAAAIIFTGAFTAFAAEPDLPCDSSVGENGRNAVYVPKALPQGNADAAAKHETNGIEITFDEDFDECLINSIWCKKRLIIPDGTMYYFGRAGQILRIEDRYGNKVNYFYTDSIGIPSRITAPNGEEITVSRTSNDTGYLYTVICAGIEKAEL